MVTPESSQLNRVRPSLTLDPKKENTTKYEKIKNICRMNLEFLRLVMFYLSMMNLSRNKHPSLNSMNQMNSKSSNQSFKTTVVLIFQNHCKCPQGTPKSSPYRKIGRYLTLGSKNHRTQPIQLLRGTPFTKCNSVKHITLCTNNH